MQSLTSSEPSRQQLVETEIHVGYCRARFLVPPTVLRENSTVFQAALSDRCGYRGKPLRLTDIEPEGFNLYYRWISGWDILPRSDGPEGKKFYPAAATLYKLADRFGNLEACNTIIERIEEFICMNDGESHPDFEIAAEMLTDVDSEPSSPLFQIMVDTFFCRYCCPTLRANQHTKLGSAILEGFERNCEEIKAYAAKGGWVKDRGYNLHPCRYHQHDDLCPGGVGRCYGVEWEIVPPYFDHDQEPAVPTTVLGW